MEKVLTVKLLRERGVKPRKEVLERLKEQRRIRKLIAESLRSGPKTIPEIARETSLPAPLVTWYVMTMRRYGEIEEAGEDGEYYRYALVAEGENED